MMGTSYEKLKNVPGFADSFLERILKENPQYGFLPKYRYFVDNKNRWAESFRIQDRILAPVSLESGAAWNQWRQFRSAQAEVTAIFLVEISLRGRVTDLELPQPGINKTCDLATEFEQKTVYLEVKAQSGQQHADEGKHPLSGGSILFSPQFEEDLSSWLFDQGKISSKTGMPMIPKCKEAAEKGADVLLAFMDIFQSQTTDLISLGQHLVPDYQGVETGTFMRKSIGNAKLNRRYPTQLDVVTIIAGERTTSKFCNLREIWLCNDSGSETILILRASGVSAILSPRPMAGFSRGGRHRTRW
jgi:hypothetical protein